MSGELKFPLWLSKKEDDTAAPAEKEVLHLSKKYAKKTFLQLAKKGIIHLSKRSTSSNLYHIPVQAALQDACSGPSYQAVQETDGGIPAGKRVHKQ